MVLTKIIFQIVSQISGDVPKVAFYRIISVFAAHRFFLFAISKPSCKNNAAVANGVAIVRIVCAVISLSTVGKNINSDNFGNLTNLTKLLFLSKIEMIEDFEMFCTKREKA